MRRAAGEGAEPAAVRCPECNARVEIRDRDGTVMVVCGSCGSALDVSVPGKAELLHAFETARRQAAGNPIELGARGRFKGQEWEAIGRIRWVQREGSQTWWWDEIQLRGDDGRYAYLTLEEGHWTWSEPVRRAIETSPRHLSPGSTVREWGRKFQVKERSDCEIDYVEGELTWVAARGDRLEFMDAAAPPEMLSAEWTEHEMEWSLGKWLPRERVAEMFGLPLETMPYPVGVAPHQPFEQDEAQRRRVKFGLIAAGILFLVAMVAAIWPGQKILLAHVPAEDYLSEDGATTPAFQVPEGNHICRLEIRSDVDNSWVAMDIGVVNDRQEVLLEAESTVEYYRGRDSEGSWSEGSRKESQLLRLPGPAVYRLVLFGSSGTWPESSRTPAHDVTVVVRRGVFPVRYALIASILAILYPLKEIGRSMRHKAAQAPETDD